MTDKNLNSVKREASDFELKSFVLRYIRYWYFFAIALIIGYVVAKYYNWYKTPVYAITAKLLVKDKSGAKDQLLQQLDVESPTMNIENEIEIFRSHNLITKVLNQLDFEVSYYLVGDIKVSEVYKDCPFSVSIENLDYLAYSQGFNVNLVDSENFVFRYKLRDAEKVFKGKYGESFDMGLGKILLSKRDNFPENLLADSKFEKRNYRVKFNTIAANQNKYLSKLVVAISRPQSTVLQIYLEDEVPQKGLDFVNALITEYLKNDVDVKNKAASNTAAFLDGQLKSITQDLERIETNRENYKVSKGIINLESESQVVLESIKDLDAQKAINDTRLNMINQLKSYIQENQDVRNLAPASLDLNDALLIKLINKLSELQSQRELVINQSTVNDPTLVPINAEIELTRSSLLENIKNIEQSLKSKSDEFDQSLDKFQSRIARIPTTERELLEIERKFRIQENLYIFLLQKHAELGISLAATESDTRIVDNARVVPGAISPVPQRAYSIALLLALLLPALFIVTIEKLNDRVENIGLIRRLTGIPILGVVRFNKLKSSLVAVDKPRSSIAEEYRSIRTNLQFFNSENNSSVIMVTSSVGTEGKTFTAMNLAAVMAASGARVVLVGLDMRKPKILESFDIQDDIGCSNYLSGNASIDEIIFDSGYLDTLKVVPSGPNPPNPSELVMSDRMGDLISELKTRFDKIIIDTPPIGLVSDGLMLANLADTILFVVRDGVTHKNHILHVNELYEQGQLKNVAIVFNAVRKKSAGSSYNSGYGYGYGYVYGADYGDYFEGEKRGGSLIRNWFNRSKKDDR